MIYNIMYLLFGENFNSILLLTTNYSLHHLKKEVFLFLLHFLKSGFIRRHLRQSHLNVPNYRTCEDYADESVPSLNLP